MMIDAWDQHPTRHHTHDPIFDSLRRWTGTRPPEVQLPVAATLAAMDEATKAAFPGGNAVRVFGLAA